MSYQVLARKWRPRNFKEMVGQEHVLRALINALDSDRLHHAYLFTGTRGVGKTTIARILAKCLNCETGVTSEPCGECSSCVEIAEGNFVDLIEVDAASRTKVEDTRELLDNVQYAPTRGRFKVYLIDEVHMLTGHSFNALLKTLEEPPPHVKFLFATTDPQKLPVTILSRCLQFNLKRMPVDMISGHLAFLLGKEKIPFEEPSLRLIARAADGSMRDALSLLDQSIAFSGANLKEADVRDMLGTISHEPLLSLLQAVKDEDGAAILQQVEDLASITPDFEAATDALIALLHQLAVQQVVPDAQQDDDNITAFAKTINKEEVQLFYQIALHGRRDLPLSPDPRSGFEMLLLRMMSFAPLSEGLQHSETEGQSKKKRLNETESRQNVDKAHKEKKKVAQKAISQDKAPPVSKAAEETPPPWDDVPDYLQTKEVATTLKTRVESKPVKAAPAKKNSVATPEMPKNEVSSASPGKLPTQWHEIVPLLKLGGRATELIKHCLLESNENGIVSLTLDKGSEGLLAETVQGEIEAALSRLYDKKIQLKLAVEAINPNVDEKVSAAETPAQRQQRLIAEKQQQAENNIASDPFVIELQNRFGAQIVPGSVSPKSN